MTQPRFTVLIPSYNQAAFLPPALDSLRAQTCGDWEAVVVDDGSGDDTPQVLAAQAADEPRIRFFRQPNGGCAAALNTALRNARGRWITWLSSDDLFEPDKLAVHLEAMREHPQTLFFHSHFKYLYDPSMRIAEPDLWRPLPQDWQQVAEFMGGNYVHGNSICIRRDCFDAVGWFDEDSRQGQDFDMWMRLSASHVSRFINRRTCVTRWHDAQTTNAFPDANFFDSARACILFLDANPLERLYPLLDLADPESAAMALSHALGIACDTRAFLYRLGPTPALWNRLAEWLSTGCPQPLRAPLVQALEPLVREVAPQLPRPLARAAVRLLRAAHEPLPYAPRPFLEFLDECVAAAAADAGRSQALTRYRQRFN